MSMKLYTYFRSSAAYRVRIALNLKGLDVEMAPIHLLRKGGEQLGEAYRRINPQCTVPALRTEEGVVLTDNAAITTYLEAFKPDPPLLGITPLEKAEVASWNWRAEFEGLLAIAEALRNGSPAMANRALPGPRDYPQIPELAQRGVARVHEFFGTLEARLQGRAFVATERFSVADITAAVAVDFARVVKVKPGEAHPNLLRWRAALAERPSLAL